MGCAALQQWSYSNSQTSHSDHATPLHINTLSRGGQRVQVSLYDSTSIVLRTSLDADSAEISVWLPSSTISSGLIRNQSLREGRRTEGEGRGEEAFYIYGGGIPWVFRPLSHFLPIVAMTQPLERPHEVGPLQRHLGQRASSHVTRLSRNLRHSDAQGLRAGRGYIFIPEVDYFWWEESSPAV